LIGQVCPVNGQTSHDDKSDLFEWRGVQMKGYYPCCKAELIPAPRRKKKYPECSQAMYVRDDGQF